MTERATLRLTDEGHNSCGLCEKCWSEAAVLYAGGQGAYESHTAAYYAVMSAHEDRVRALTGSDGTDETGGTE